jgi:ribonuclease PH
MNLVMTGSGKFVEVQGTAEADPFSPAQLAELTAIGAEAIAALLVAQRAVLSRAGAA